MNSTGKISNSHRVYRAIAYKNYDNADHRTLADCHNREDRRIRSDTCSLLDDCLRNCPG